MRKKLPILLGMVFLMTLMSLMIVPASFPCDWATYGGELSITPNSQYYYDCNGRFNGSYYEKSYAYGMNNAPYQPLVAGLGAFEEPRLILQNGNYLQVLDDNLDLVTEFNTGALVGQFDVGNFLGEGKSNSIAGFWRINASTIQFRMYKYIEDTLSLNLTYSSIPISKGSATSSNGVKCSSGINASDTSCYTIIQDGGGSAYSLYFYKFNVTGGYIYGNLIGSNTPQITEPVSYADWNEDGVTEFLFYGFTKAYIHEPITNNTYSFSLGTAQITITGAKFFFPIQSQTYNTWWQKLFMPDVTKGSLVITSACNYFPSTCRCGYSDVTTTAYKNDYSTLWTSCENFGGSSGDYLSSFGLMIGDFNGDLKDDVWVGVSSSEGSNRYKIFKGSDGSTLLSKLFSSGTGLVSYYSYKSPATSSTLVRLNGDSMPEIMTTAGNKIVVFNPATQTILFNKTGGVVSIPADLNFDGMQEIITTGTTTKALFSNYTNANPTIVSLTIDPSTTIQVGGTINVFITATDPEDDLIFYSVICYTGANASTEDYSNVKSCTYNSLGEFSMTIRVRDYYHINSWTTFSQTILVTQTGVICGNGICETGETSSNCPSDCPVSQQNQTQATATGGMPLPTKIVDVNNVEQGLLPEIYYGILGFLSNTLSPMIILVFAIFFVLIMLTLAFIIKRTAHRIGTLTK